MLAAGEREEPHPRALGPNIRTHGQNPAGLERLERTNDENRQQQQGNPEENAPCPSPNLDHGRSSLSFARARALSTAAVLTRRLPDLDDLPRTGQGFAERDVTLRDAIGGTSDNGSFAAQAGP